MQACGHTGAAGHRCLPRRTPRARNRSSPWCKREQRRRKPRVPIQTSVADFHLNVCGDAVWPCRRLPTCRPQVFEEGASASSLQRPNWIAAADAASHADGCHTLPARRHGRRAQRARPRGRMHNARLELRRPRQRVCVVVSTSGGKHGVGGSVGADAVRRGSHIPTTTDGLHKRRESACRRQFCGRSALCRQTTALLGARSRWMELALAWSDSEGLIALASLILAPLPRSRVATAIRFRLGRLGGAVTYSKNGKLD